jgi:hypothetical protein
VAVLELLTIKIQQMTIESTTQQLPLNPPLLIVSVSGCTSWDEWLEKTETSLKEIGYRKYKQNLKHEDFAYWKKFEGYQVGLFFYDFRKHQNEFNIPERIGVQFECMFTDIDERIDLSVSKDISLEQFEIMARTFHDAMFQYCH